MTGNIYGLTEKDELVLEKNLVLLFPLPQTEWVAKIILSNQKLILNPMLGEHLGIVTDRRKEGFSTNKDFHGVREDYFFSDKYKNTWKIFLRKLILNRINVQFMDLQQPIIVIEHPASNFAADTIVECLPNSKVIIIESDGTNHIEHQVFTLLRDKQVKDGLKLFSSEEKIPFIKQQSNRWLKMMRVLSSMKKIHSKDKLMIIKIDEILNDTKENLKKIYDFLGITIDKNEIEEIKKKIENENYKISLKNADLKLVHTLSNDEKEIVNKILENISIND